jgi:hypothetical protein
MRRQWVLGYSPEYQRFEADVQLLEEIASLTEGRNLAEEPPAAFAHTLASERSTRPIWPWLTFLAILLLPLDVAVRRLAVTRRDLARAWAATFGRLRPQVATPQRSERVSRLFEAKQRAGTTPSAGLPDTPAPVARRDAAQAEPEGEDPSGATPSSAPASPPLSRPEPTGSLAARLLEKKRQQQEETDAD